MRAYTPGHMSWIEDKGTAELILTRDKYARDALGWLETLEKHDPGCPEENGCEDDYYGACLDNVEIIKACTEELEKRGRVGYLQNR